MKNFLGCIRLGSLLVFPALEKGGEREGEEKLASF
jgi:hypothetical protein